MKDLKAELKEKDDEVLLLKSQINEFNKSKEDELCIIREQYINKFDDQVKQINILKINIEEIDDSNQKINKE